MTRCEQFKLLVEGCASLTLTSLPVTVCVDLPHQETGFEEQRSGRRNEAAVRLLHSSGVRLSSLLAQLRERLTQLFFIAEGTEHAGNELLTKRKCIREEYETKYDIIVIL